MIKLNKSFSKGGVRFDVIINPNEIAKIEDKIEKLKVVIQSTVEIVGNEIRDTWVNNAKSSLRSSDNYAAAVIKGAEYPVNGDAFTYQIFPEYTKKSKIGEIDIIKIVEFGFEPFDMKEKLLAGHEKKIIKFEYGKPGSGRSLVLPNKINEMMEQLGNLKFTKKNVNKIFGHGVFEDDTINWLVTRNYTVLKANKVNFPNHTAAIQPNGNLEITFASKRTSRYSGRIFEGLKKEKSGMFSNYRTLSKNSPAGSWIHPGLVAKKVFEITMDRMTPVIRMRFQKAIQTFAE